MSKRILVVPVFCIVAALTLCISSVSAKNVSQTLGFKDVAFSSLNKQFCKGCHGDSLVETHHETAKFDAGACAFCHTVSKHNGNLGVVLQRDCLKCHLDSPHHKTELARNKECTSCHDTVGVSDYSTKGPDYGVSKVTPAVANCGRCHGDGNDGDTKVVGYKDTHHGIGLEDCNACHTNTDPKAVDIRVCERCHNVQTIHSVAHHVAPENCVVCHITEKK